MRFSSTTSPSAGVVLCKRFLSRENIVQTTVPPPQENLPSTILSVADPGSKGAVTRSEVRSKLIIPIRRK